MSLKNNNLNLNSNEINRFSNYKLEDYIFDVENIGLEKTWDKICLFCLEKHPTKNGLISVNNFGEMYEIGLAIEDKLAKKKSGQYYTPDDVANIMAQWLNNCEGDAVCDVACGTGKLILTYLKLIGFDSARTLILNKKLFLYDFDKVALKICKTAILMIYGFDLEDKVNDIYGDFLDEKIILPKNCKVIANPPYAKIENFPSTWRITNVTKDTKEFYSVFMEKIFKQSKSTVIITPFSFISGKKFQSLRQYMCEIGNGSIFAFDNVPGNIFCGRKHGIFNTNTANSVRAAITVFSKSESLKGFRVTPLIRFKNEERNKLLKCDILEKLLSNEYQICDKQNTMFKKVFKELEPIYNSWISNSTFKVKDLLSKTENDFIIDMPNTCRYFTTGSAKKLSRGGSIVMYARDEDTYNFLYCFINSSFTYWWWRIFDGGITYPTGLLFNMPIPLNLLINEEDKKFFKNMRIEMVSKESSYTVTKVNAGVPQQNIKFPDSYRIDINNRICKLLNIEIKNDIFSLVHSNKFGK